MKASNVTEVRAALRIVNVKPRSGSQKNQQQLTANDVKSILSLCYISDTNTLNMKVVEICEWMQTKNANWVQGAMSTRASARDTWDFIPLTHLHLLASGVSSFKLVMLNFDLTLCILRRAKLD